MDYLDPRKEARHRVVLLIGYVCIAIAIAIAAIILLYQAYGFGVRKDGTVIQNDLTFFSSQPHPASIYVNGKLKATTNTRLSLPGGIYRITLARDGYRDWQRTIELAGGQVEHFDYPLLFPKTLTTKKIQTYDAAPGLVTQSPDRRWLLVQKPATMTSFQVYDLKNPTKAPETIELPASLLTKAAASEKWQLEEWAGDNRHVVLEHDYDGKIEFVLIDRSDPAKSLNLNATLSANPSKLTLRDKKYNQYYLYGTSPGLLQSATLEAPTAVTVLEHVLMYHSYGADTLLYATDTEALAGKVFIRLKTGDTTYPVRTSSASTTYLLDLAKYSGDLYVAAGASSENKVYIYKDPIGQLRALPGHAVVPTQVLHVDNPNYLAFSTNAQFIVTESGTQFGVYDIENTKGYSFVAKQPLDTGVEHAAWMDGNRLAYVSGGTLIVFDYDYNNQQTLMDAGAAYLPAFAPDYRDVYTVAPATTPSQFELTQTSLLIPADR